MNALEPVFMVFIFFLNSTYLHLRDKIFVLQNICIKDYFYGKLFMYIAWIPNRLLTKRFGYPNSMITKPFDDRYTGTCAYTKIILTREHPEVSPLEID